MASSSEEPLARRGEGVGGRRLRLRPSFRLGERGFCPGGRASGSERGEQEGFVPLPFTLLDKVLYSALLFRKHSI